MLDPPAVNRLPEIKAPVAGGCRNIGKCDFDLVETWRQRKRTIVAIIQVKPGVIVGIVNPHGNFQRCGFGIYHQQA